MAKAEEGKQNMLANCREMPNASAWERAAIITCEVGAYTAHGVAVSAATTAYGAAALSIEAEILAYETGRSIFCLLQYNNATDACKIGYDLCVQGYGVDENGCPCK